MKIQRRSDKEIDKMLAVYDALPLELQRHFVVGLIAKIEVLEKEIENDGIWEGYVEKGSPGY